MTTRRCAYIECGIEFEPKRSDQLYCSAKHRTYAYRRRARADKKLASLDQRFSQDALIERLAAFAPKTAAKVEAFRDELGRACLDGAIRLALAAYTEGRIAEKNVSKKHIEKVV